MLKENLAPKAEAVEKQSMSGTGELRELLANQPEAANLLFAEYARFVDGTERAAAEISKLYNELFFEKRVDKNLVAEAILKRASRLLVDAESELKSAPEEEKRALVERLAEGLVKEQAAQKSMLEDLKAMFLKLNKQYEEIYREYDDIQHDCFKSEAMAKEFPIGGNGEDMEDYDDYLDMMKEMEYHPATAWSADEAHELAQEKKRVYEKFDSQRIEKLMDEMYKLAHKLTDEIGGKGEGIFYGFDSETVYDFIDKLKELLAYQQALEKKMDEIVLGEFHAPTDEKLKERYEEIKQTALNVSRYILENFGAQGKYLNADEAADQLMGEAINVIAMPTATEDERVLAGKKLEKTRAEIVLLEKILKQLPPEEVGRLDLTKLTAIERLEYLAAADLAENREVVGKMKAIIDKQFPAGDGQAFLGALNENHDLKFTVTLANGEILSFFSKEEASGNIDYIDWFIANPDAPIKGLGEATARLGFEERAGQERSYYAVIKPHVKSFNIFIEKLGFAAFGGSTLDGEYKHHYARARRLPGDAELSSKNFDAESEADFEAAVKRACPEDKTAQSLIFNGRSYEVAKITYHGQTHHDDITKNDPDGWIFNELARQTKRGLVLARFIPADSGKDNQTYYAVFEKDQAPARIKNELDGIIPYEAKSSHSLSKKAASN